MSDRLIVDEWPCNSCDEGICCLFATPDVARLAYGVTTDWWVYRCDRCGEKFAVAGGAYASATGFNRTKVAMRKRDRSGVKWSKTMQERLDGQRSALGFMYVDLDKMKEQDDG